MSEHAPSNSRNQPSQNRRGYYLDLGRQLVDEDWLGKFHVGLAKHLDGSGMTFRPLVTPSIIYLAGGREIKPAAKKRGSIVAGAKNSLEALETLIEKGVIDEKLALKGLTLYVKELVPVRLDTGDYSIKARVLDVLDEASNTAIMSTETNSLRQAVTPDTYQFRQLPTQNLNFGTLVANGGSIRPADLAVLHQGLGEEIMVGGIEEIKAFAYIDKQK